MINKKGYKILGPTGPNGTIGPDGVRELPKSEIIKQKRNQNIEIILNMKTKDPYLNPPLSRIVKEGDAGTCKVCRSSEKRKYNIMGISFGEKIGCINPECPNYYNSLQYQRSKKINKII